MTTLSSDIQNKKAEPSDSAFIVITYASSVSGMKLLMNSITILKIASIFAKISSTIFIVAPPVTLY